MEDTMRLNSNPGQPINWNSSLTLRQAMQPVNKVWPALAIDLLMKSELADEASSSSTQNMDGDKCWVCGCAANGRHYGVMACFGCKGFFRRSVQGGKNYICRHERQCVIDQSDRNCCRSCRFNKCLSVGMDPAAIQPDRDKTGRQRNPRKSAYARNNSSSPTEHPDPPSTHHSDSEGEVTATDRIIMDTLVEIEEICAALKPEISISAYQSLTTAVEKPSSVFSRTSVRFDANCGEADSRTIRDDVLRLCVLMLDYVSTLRPLADVPLHDKVAVVRQCLAPFIVLVLGYHAAQREDYDSISLPSGHIIRSNHTFLESYEETKDTTLLQIKAKALHKNFIEQIVLPLRRMEVSLSEMAAVKAILTLDPHAPGIGDSSSHLLTSGREAVQKALFAMLRSKMRSSDATSRFGHLLIFITSVTRVSAQLLTLMNQMEEMNLFSDPVIMDLFHQIY